LKASLATSPTTAKFAPLLFAGDLTTALESAARLGYDGVELNLRDSAQIDRTDLLARLEHFGLSVPSIGTGQSYFGDGLSLADPDREIQAAVRRRMRDHILLAAELGSRVVIGSIRGRLDDQSTVSRQACCRIAVESTQSLAEFAATHGVGLTVEPINRYETNFLNTIDDTLDFVNQVDTPNLGILADTFHMNIEETSMVGALRRAGSRLCHVHLVDSNRRAPGMGHLDFGPIIGVLEEMGYSNWLSAEILPLPDDETAARSWIVSYGSLTAT
jgi:sugar phosphate isomerase/epimerase